MLAAASSSVGAVVRGPQQPAAVLGVAGPALYLQAPRGVLAVVTSDAVRLPCAVALARSSAEFSLRDVPPDGFVTVGTNALRWTSHGRAITIDVVREWLPAHVRPVVPRAERLAELRERIEPIDLGIGLRVPSPASLLGFGPGLTPSGDDVIAGYLLGCRTFGMAAPALSGLERTTALSAALLRCAERGECVLQLAALVAALGTDEPLTDVLDALLAVGHTSGAALAAGVLLAAQHTTVIAA